VNRWLVLAIVLYGGCAPSLPDGFTCTVSSQCVSAGQSGVCEQPASACSFPDASCASGRRYGTLGPTQVAGMCVTDGGASGGISRGGTSSRPAGVPSGGGVTLASPGGLAAGDLMLACVFADVSAATVAPPTGWTQHASLDGGVAGSFHAAWFFKVAAASEPSSYVFSVGGNPGSVTAGLVVYRGVDTGNPFDAATNQSFAATDFTAPSITTTRPNAMLVAMFVNGTPGTLALQAPGGMSSAVDVDELGMFDQLQASAGPTGTRTATLGLPVPGIGAVDFVALRPTP
jgi:hypothetical protein